MARQPRYPRINCCIPGCKRGSTAYEPGTSVICGKCWRKAPKATRQAWTRWRRRGKRFEGRDDPRSDLCCRRADAIWSTVRSMLADPTQGAGEAVPPILAEQLRKDGLL